MLIPHWLKSLRNRLHHPVRARVSKKRRHQRVAPKQVTTTVEFLEERVLLAGAGPQLISIFPNAGITQPEDTGGRLQQDEVLETAPRELVFRFNPGQVIDPASIQNGIQVFGSGFDGSFSNGKVQVDIGSIHIGDQPNEVVMRFEDSLPDDHYQIILKGSGSNPLRNDAQVPFNNGVDLEFNFEVDLGGMIEAVVHEPIVRSQILQVTDTDPLADGVSFTVQAGGKPITFVFDDNNSSNADNDNVFAINISNASSTAEYATAIRTALNNAAIAHGTSFGLLASSVSGQPSQIRLSPTADTAFSPKVTPDANVASGMTITDHAIQQRKNFINVYFNANDPLNTISTLNNPSIVQSPAFYQLINTDGTMRLPDSVIYDADAGVATLRFNQSFDDGTYNLRIGETFEATNTLASTVNLGTRFGNVTTTINDFIGGDPTSPNLDPNDVDLYRFEIKSGGDVMLELKASNGLDGYLRVFDTAGNEVAVLAANNGTGAQSTTITLAAGVYIVGISSQGNIGYDSTDGTGRTGGLTTGSYRLAITPNVADVSSSDDNSSFDVTGEEATDLGNLGTAGQVVTAAIQPQVDLLLPPEPGGNDEPGHRDIPVFGENHLDNLGLGGRGTDPYAPSDITTVAYTFESYYGNDIQGNPLFNAITEAQKQRTREVMELYSLISGIQFVEAATRAEARAQALPVFTVVTGDLRAVSPSVPTGPGGVAGIAGFSNGTDPDGTPVGFLAVMDAGENFSSNDNLYGQSWFRIAMHEIGHVLGLDHDYDLNAIMSFLTGEPVFPGDNDIVHIRRLYRRDAVDIDMYKFQVTEAGRVTIETIAERLSDLQGASQLNTVLRLYRQEVDGSRTLIAQNDDYFGDDSFIDINLTAGTYFVGVSSVGNEDYDPSVANSGAEGRTDGRYELRLDLRPGLQPLPDDPLANPSNSPTYVTAKGRTSIRDVDNSVQYDGTVRKPTAFDGDADGHAGGQSSYSFQVGDAQDGEDTGNTNSEKRSTIFVDKAAANYRNLAAPLGSLANPFTEIDLALNAARNLRLSFDSADPPNPTPVIVRIVGNSGADGQVNTLLDNRAYEIGINNDPINPQVLVDGAMLQVPRDVNVVIDEGAVFKLQDANLDAGSSAQGLDRSGGSLQILGTTFHNVTFTSWHNDSIGGDSDGVHPGAKPGDWGGIVFREDSDYDFEYSESQTKTDIYAQSNPFVYNFRGLPIPATDATLSFLAYGDFNEPGENLTIQFEDSDGNLIAGSPSFVLFDDPADPNIPDATSITATIRLSQDQLLLVAADGEIHLRVTPSNGGTDATTVNNINVIESLRVDLSMGTAVPIFLNTVNHATIEYAGGPVAVDSISQDFDAIHLVDARPTITNNTITLSANAAISGNPNSFNDSFEDPRHYDHHLDRLGPEVHGNDIFNNSINGLRIRTNLQNGVPLEKLEVPARFTSTDIVYVITENFQIEGSPGGLIIDPGDDPDITTDDVISSRMAGRLRIDPGVVVKFSGSRVELERGSSNLIAEGTPENPIIFTSISDDKYGRGGSFDTANDGAPFQDFGLSTLDVTFTAQGPSPSTDGQVENVSPNDEVVGATHVIAADPSDPDRLFIGGTNGGIWRTTNATAASPTWTPLTDQLGSLSIGALEFDPTDSTNQTLVAGIGRYSSFGRQGGNRTGLLRTTDGGDSWSVINGGGVLTGKNISGVAARGDTIVVSVNTADSFTFGNIGIFRSSDGGATFTQISVGDGSTTGLPGGVAYDLAADPSDPNILYTSVAFSGIVGGQVGIYKSVNAGLSWTKVSDAAIDAFIDNGTSNLTGTSNLEISVGTSNNVYAGIINAGMLAALFRSGDGGATWVQMDTPSTNEGGTDVGLNPGGGKGPAAGSPPDQLAGGQGSIHFSILADPGDPNIVYVGGDRQPRSNGDTGSFPNSIGAFDFSGRLFRGDASQPLGSQFVHLTHSSSLGPAGGGTASSSAPHADSRELAFDASGNLLESDDGGIYRRTSPRDNTGDWFSIIGNLQITEVHDVAYDSVSNILITGNQDTGTTQQTSSGSAEWESVSTADGGDVAVDDTSTPGRSFRYSSFQNLGAFRRREYDANNTLINETFINTSGIVTDPQFVTPVVLNNVNAQRMIIGGSGNLYESTNQGNTISQIAPIGANSGSAIAYGGFIGSNPNPNVLWVGSGSQVFLRTTAGGPVNNLPAYNGGTVRGVFIDPNDWRIAFVVDSDQIFMTTDAGATFTDITGATTFDTDLRSITYVPGTTTDALLVGGRGGVYAMDLRTPGAWFNLGTNLPNAPAYDMEYDAVDDVLVVGTLGRGTFSLTNASQLIIQELNANQPKPIGLSPTPGDWAGFVFNAASSGNFDYVEIRYGGGLAPIAGGFAAFNPVEIIQSDVRISNSVFKNNADGRDSGTTSGNRIGRGSNVASTIFVRGAQPTIVSNIFENNESLVISVNANAMNSEVNPDQGRATGALFSDPLFGSADPNITTEYANNYGPLVRNNRLTGNGINGMEVRGAELTTETVWDDTDIVHILRSEIVVPNLHTYGGLRLQSSGRESLVVKLQGSNAGFTAGGTQLDIDDRVGGTLEIVGTPGRPVVLTSLFDNTVGAGFAPDGTPLLNTVDPATNPAPNAGDWRSVKLDEFSNDRNVAVYLEKERPTRLDSDVNNIPNVQPNGAEPVGTLAPSQAAADDNRRAGFEIHGFINTDDPTDQDVYSFIGTAGTEVWFDIDRTASSLDTVLELINADGSIVYARSDNSQDEEIDPKLIDTYTDVDAVPLRKDERLGGDFYTTNPKDAGMRVILPGNAGTNNTYFIRVRSKGPSVDAATNPGQPGSADGITSGEYQLQIRLQQRDEHPGSTVMLSEIRYATNGIEIYGQPSHSPLVGETGEQPELRFNARQNDTFVTATYLGNLLATDLNTFSVAGNLSEQAITSPINFADDFDFYKFDIDYQGIQQIAGVNDGLNPFSLTFDIDYSDGLARPNTSLYIIREAINPATGQLERSFILRSTDSNIADDRPAPLEANNLDDISRGTVGALDPYIGSIQLLEGTYYAVVTSSYNAPQVLNQFSTTNSASNGLRLQPIDSIFRVTEDHIENGGFSGANQGGQTGQDSTTLTQLFDTSNPNYDTSNPNVVRPQSSIVPWSLGDVSLIISRDDPNDGTSSTELVAVNPFTGVVEATYGTFSDDVRDIDINRRTGNGSLENGTIIAFDVQDTGNRTDANNGDLLTIDVENNASPTVISRQDDGILTYVPNTATPPGPVRPNNGAGVGIRFNAITYNNGVSNSDRMENNLLLYGVGVRNDNVSDSAQLLYEFTSAGVAQSDPAPQDRSGNGLLNGAQTQIIEHGILDTNISGSTDGTALIVSVAGDSISDGDQLSVDTAPPVTTFTMDSGPSGNFNVDVANNRVVRDGDFLIFDPDTGVTGDEVRFEFEGGPVLQVLTTSGLSLLGDTFSITDNANTTVTFEFTFNNNTPGPGRIGIDLTGANSRNAIASRIVTAITNLGAAFNVVARSLNNNTGRIVLENDISVNTSGSNPADLTTDGDYGLVDPVNNPGTLVRIEEDYTSEQIAFALSNAVNGVNPGYSLTRANFPTYQTFDTISFQTSSVFTNLGTMGDAGDSDPLSINYYFGQTADQIATSISAAVNANTTATTVALGGVVQIGGGLFVNPTDDPPFEIGGAAPGGFITGTAVVNGQLFAVTDNGGFFRITGPQSLSAGLSYIATSAALLPYSFQGLTALPPNVEGGAYNDLLIGVTGDGTLVAFNTAGVLQPVFLDGQSTLRISDPFNRDNSGASFLSSVHGISFSNLDENLWHVTSDRNTGGVSLGFTNERDPLNSATNTYGFLTGGAHGTMETADFSLEGYSAADQPTLYFNYFLETENANGGPTGIPSVQEMRDAFRVYIADEDGTWDLITTNNSNERGLAPSEVSNNAPFRVQEAFDNSGSWRQARIDLSAYAGKSNLQLRFEFSTAASLDVGNILTGGDELRAREGASLWDGDTFTISAFRGPSDRASGTQTNVTYEFDMDHTIVLPPGGQIVDGDQITITDVNSVSRTFTFVLNGTTGGTTIGYSFSDTATDLASRLALRINAQAGFAVIPHLGPVPGQRLQLENAIGVTENTNILANATFARFRFGTGSVTINDGSTSQTFTGTAESVYNQILASTLNVRGLLHGDTIAIYDATSVNAGFGVDLKTEGRDGSADGQVSAAGNIVLRVNADMTDDQVADVIRRGLANYLLLQSDGVSYRSVPIQNIKAYREVVRVLGHSVTDPGPLGLTTFLPTNDPTDRDADYGEFDSNLRNRNNNFEGVYIDDILIGFAERGEIITGASANNLNFTQSATGSQIFEGNYQLEIRRGTDYTIGQLPAAALVPANILDTNDRSTDQITIKIPDGQNLFDGQSFQLSDGVQTLVFEFEDLDLRVGDPNFGIGSYSDFAVGFRADESAHVIAARLRDLLNSTQVRNRLKITSALAEGSQIPGPNNTTSNFGGFSNEVNVFGVITAAINGSVQNTGSNLAGYDEVESNDTIATAQSLESLPFSLQPNQNIHNRNIQNVSKQYPHTTINGTGNGTFDYYSFTIANANDRAIFDIDGASFDTELFLYDLNGNLLASDDDGDQLLPAFTDPGSTSSLDSFLEYTFATPGTYVIGVGRFNSFGSPGGIQGAVPALGDTYTLQVAIQNHAFSSTVEDFGDSFNILGNLEFEYFADTNNSSRNIGDSNLPRVQGSVQISQNFIFNTANVGILVDDRTGQRLAGEQPVIGTPRQLPTPNVDRLTRGVKISNNVVAYFGDAGIVLDGDENPGVAGPLASVPFHRVINNTIYGGATPTGDGIRAANNVAPTLLNNIIANTNVAIRDDGSIDNDIVAARTTFSNNNTRGIDGTNPQIILPGEPLFVDPTTNNFYLAAGARPIDSARNQLEDRDSIVQVSASIGIPQSNLFAPEFDAYGQFRTDDEDTPNSGEGSRPFFDRGAIEREDISGPSARLIAPEDNDGQGFDLNPNATEVYLENAVIRSFVVGLDDIGIGIDDSSVISTNVQLTRDGMVLTAGVDYLFRYNANTKQITLEAASGVFAFGAYRIDLINNNGIRDLAGNDLLANRQPAGTTAFDIVISPPPEFTISAVTDINNQVVIVSEGDGAPTFAEFLVTLSGPTRAGATVNIQTTDTGTAKSTSPEQDYIPRPLQTLIFDDNPLNDPDGDPDNNPLTQIFRVEILGDLRPEGDENFFVTLSDAVNASIAVGKSQAEGIINDDDLLVRLSPTTQRQVEGDVGTTDMNFTVTLIDKGTNAPILTSPGFDVMVNYSTANNTAIAGQDYVATSGTITIPDGSNTATFAVPIIGDEIQEVPALEDFTVSLSNPVNAGIDSAFQVATGEIQDDDPKFRVEGAPVIVEGESGTTPIRQMIFTVSISSAVVSPVSVDYTTQDGTAVGGMMGDPNIDYLSTSGTLTFNPGGPLTQTVAVTIVGDLVAEGDETINLMLSNPTAGGIAVGTGTGTILDDDPQISINDITVTEGDFGTTNATFTVSLSQASPTDVTVDFSTSLGNTLPAPSAGQIYETTPNSTFNQPEVLDPRGFGRVANPNINDTQGNNVSGLIDHLTVLGRGNGDFDYYSFNGTIGQRVILDIDGATFNSQIFLYAPNGTITRNDDGFPNGGPNGDGTDPGSNSTEDSFLETVLTQTGRYIIAVGRSSSTATTAGLTGTPLHSGDQYTLHASLANYTVPPGTIFEENLSTGEEAVPNDSLASPRSLEGEYFNTTFNPNINDTTGANISTSVPYVIIQGTGDGTADYYSFNVTTPGSFGYFDIDGASFDTVLQVFDPNGNIIASNDDGPVLDTGSSSFLDSLTRAFFSVTGTYVVRVVDLGNADDTLDPGSTYRLNVAIENHALGTPPNVSGPTPVDGTATPGSDFTSTSGTITIPGGMNQTTATITVPVLADQINELDETFFVRLANAIGGVIQDGSGIGTIGNDDAPVISISDPAPKNETGPLGNPNILTFTVTLSRPADVATTINYTTADGTAIGGLDYVAQSGQLMFAIGEQTKTINVQLIKDGELNEPTETFFVNLSNPVGADFGDNQAVGTILDNTGLVERVLSVVAPDARPPGVPGIVRVLDANGGERFNFEPYPGFSGAIRVAVGDVNNDGTPDIVTAPGPGGGPDIKVYSGVNGALLMEFMAYSPNFTGGVFVAVGDFAEGVFTQGDSFDDIVVGADAGGGAHVRAFSTAVGPAGNRTFSPVTDANKDSRLLYNFFPYGGFTGGVRVAAGDVTGDGVDDLVVAPGPGGGPHIQVFNGRFTGPSNPPTTSRDGRSFYAYTPNFTGGVYLAVGNVDTRAGAEGEEIITGPGTGGGPHVRVFNVKNLGTAFAINPPSVAQFFAFNSSFTGGVRVGVGFANDADTNLDVLVAPGPGGGANLIAYSGASVASPARGNNLTPAPDQVANRFPVYSGTYGMFVAGVQNVNVQFVGAPLQAAQTGTATLTSPLTQHDVDAARAAALDRFRQAGASETDIAALSQVRITVDDLNGDLVGLATTGGIILDVNAAGNGWFIDSTPDQDEEFAGTGSQLTAIDMTAARRMDLLTVIMHELGHKLGLDDLHSQLHPDALMTATLPVGTRRLPTSEELDEAFTDDSLFDSLLLD